MITYVEKELSMCISLYRCEREFLAVAAAVRPLLANGPAAVYATVAAVTTTAKGEYPFVHDARPAAAHTHGRSL